MTTIGIVGFGEAGSAIAAGLVEYDTVVHVFDILFAGAQSDDLRRRALATGVVVDDDIAVLVAASDVILSTVVASAALDVAESLAGHITARHLVADLNSTSPGLAAQIAATVEQSGAGFVDVAVMAAVPPHRHEVPMLASGKAAEQFASLDVGFNVDVVGTAAGDASAVKMLRSLLVKGLEALLLEFALAGRKVGTTDQVLASLNGALPMHDWRELATYLLARTAQHARRRGHELEEVAATLRELDVEPMVATAGARRLLWVADLGVTEWFAEAPPAHYDDVLDALLVAPTEAEV